MSTVLCLRKILLLLQNVTHNVNILLKLNNIDIKYNREKLARSVKILRIDFIFNSPNLFPVQHSTDPYIK